MKFSAEYLAHGRNAAPEEAATVAEVRIDIGSRCATQNVGPDSRSRKSFVVMPAYVLAEGLALCWWQIVAGRGRQQNLRRMRAGYVLPDITFLGDGVDIRVHVSSFTYANPPITFEIGAEEYVPTPQFVDHAEEFIEDVLQRLREEGVRETELERRWSMIGASRANPDELAFCEAAAALGIDPYQCEDVSADLIDQAGRLFDGEALYELLAGSERPALEDSLAWVRQAEEDDREAGALPLLTDYRGAGRRFSRIRKPWSVGYAAAHNLRSDMHLGDREALPTIEELGKLFGNGNFRPVSMSDEIIRATILETATIPAVRVGPRSHQSSVLFAIARAIGDMVCYGDAERFPVMENYGTRRQTVGRAFAAEFLAPGQAVSDMMEAGRTKDEIADHFGVSIYVIEHQIDNAISDF